MKLSAYLSLLLAAFALAAPAPSAAPNPAPAASWTYTQAYNYALSEGGPLESNIVAEVIKRHVELNNFSWDSEYSDNIYTEDGNARLILAPELRKRTTTKSNSKNALEKRFNTDITSYPYNSNCSGTHFQWVNVTRGCKSYVSSGVALRMYSLRVDRASGDTGLTVNIYRDSTTCSNGATDSFTANQSSCWQTLDGRGFMSFFLECYPYNVNGCFP